MMLVPTQSLLVTPRYDPIMVTLVHVGGTSLNYLYDVYLMSTGVLIESNVSVTTGLHVSRRNYVWSTRQPATAGIAVHTTAHGDSRYIILDTNEWYSGRHYVSDYATTGDAAYGGFPIYAYEKNIRDGIDWVDLFSHGPYAALSNQNAFETNALPSSIEQVKQFSPFKLTMTSTPEFNGANHTTEKRYKIANGVESDLAGYTIEQPYALLTVAPHLHPFIPWVGAFWDTSADQNVALAFVNLDFKIVVYRILHDSLYFVQMPAPNYNTLQPRP